MSSISNIMYSFVRKKKILLYLTKLMNLTSFRLSEGVILLTSYSRCLIKKSYKNISCVIPGYSSYFEFIYRKEKSFFLEKKILNSNKK